MPTINEIQTSINNLTTGSDAHNFAILATQAVRETGNNVSSSVATVADLPDLSTNTIPNGQIVYVESLAAPVIARSDSLEWLGMNGALLRKDGAIRSILTWGRNYIYPGGCISTGFQVGPYAFGGELGINLNGNITCNYPVMIAGNNSNWCDVSSKWMHTLALKTDGTLWAWGSNSVANAGALGDGTCINALSPVPVLGNLTWCLADAGFRSSAGIRNNGALYTWGGNYCGGLGNNSVVNRCSPGPVAGGGVWCAISSGAGFTTGIQTDGTAWTWGQNNVGQLGNGTVVARSSPGTVAGGGTWCAISTSSNHTIAIKTDGSAWTWGQNNVGQLGNGTVVARSSPGTVAGGGTTWCAICASAYHTAAITTGGTLWNWGLNGYGRLGDGTVINRSSPVQVAGGGTTWCQTAGVAAIKTDGTAWTWGSGSVGQLGDCTTTNRSSPVAIGRSNWCKIVTANYFRAAINVE